MPKFSSEQTRVSIDITPQGTGCELTLVHEGVPPEWASSTQDGWIRILDNLADNLAPTSSLGTEARV